MKKQILIIGQCTLHWGRMEFGNIGNYYIARPMFQQLRRVFPEHVIATTMQFSDAFCEEFSIKTLPMELYYDFNSTNNLENAIAEYESVLNSEADINSEYIEEVKASELVIDFSGDIWGENADFLGKDRFLTGCYKDMTAQKLTKTVMLAGSPGPFSEQVLEIAKKAYKGFDFVTNREPISTELLIEQGFDVTNTKNYACPSFLFEKGEESDESLQNLFSSCIGKKKVGFILCGWNFKKGPFDLWPRDNSEYKCFVKVLEQVIDNHDACIYLMSHANAFDIPPKPFLLKQGRDFPIAKQLFEILKNDGYADNVKLLDGVYSPEQTKAIISNFDVLISGRMHGAVAGLSQQIPTLIIDYGHEPKAHKLQGMAELIGEDIIVDPNNFEEMIQKAELLIESHKDVERRLGTQIEVIKESARLQFDEIRNLVLEK